MVKKLSDEDIGKITGGAVTFDPGLLYQARFVFNETDVDILAQHGIYGIRPYVVYIRGQLNDMGIDGLTQGDMIDTLREWGISVEE